MNYSVLRKLINYGLGLVLAVWVSAVIYRQLRSQDNFDEALSHLQQDWSADRIKLAFAIVALMLFNWSLEALKWQKLLQHIQHISFIRSLRSVLTGVSVSLITPNRIGEYAGRILYLKNIHKGQAIVANILGSWAQFIVASVYGIFGIVCYWQYNYIGFLPWLLLGSIIVLLLLAYAYLHVDGLPRLTDKIKFLKRLTQYIRIVRSFSRRDLVIVILYSALRYLVFGTQFFLLLLFFEVDISFIEALPTVFLIFWCMAVLPSIALVEAPLRAELSITLLGVFSTNSVGIMAASLCLWLINIILPALLGAISTIGLRILEQLQNDTNDRTT
jgi:uncharacterized membrane protein YbhN (UPF0104 family)